MQTLNLKCGSLINVINLLLTILFLCMFSRLCLIHHVKDGTKFFKPLFPKYPDFLFTHSPFNLFKPKSLRLMLPLFNLLIIFHILQVLSHDMFPFRSKINALIAHLLPAWGLPIPSAFWTPGNRDWGSHSFHVFYL